ncbi:Probable tRNA methyltransferase 9B [Eumeta japonica]|uniref:Probable tRNA methyltransferase 9B n=1 Tax=Eumeta variegata TaxID=151549 RepID=A0A4C1WIQ7_EUMVA|nr:Probable tRNA methyltransferase 9B [Eumeta japonica]
MNLETIHLPLPTSADRRRARAPVDACCVVDARPPPALIYACRGVRLVKSSSREPQLLERSPGRAGFARDGSGPAGARAHLYGCCVSTGDTFRISDFRPSKKIFVYNRSATRHVGRPSALRLKKSRRPHRLPPATEPNVSIKPQKLFDGFSKSVERWKRGLPVGNLCSLQKCILTCSSDINPSIVVSLRSGGAGDGAAVMADGAGGGAGAGESAARGAALERAYVHDVYELAAPAADDDRPAPGVHAFLADLEPGSLVCDVACDVIPPCHAFLQSGRLGVVDLHQSYSCGFFVRERLNNSSVGDSRRGVPEEAYSPGSIGSDRRQLELCGDDGQLRIRFRGVGSRPSPFRVSPVTRRRAGSARYGERDIAGSENARLTPPRLNVARGPPWPRRGGVDASAFDMTNSIPIRHNARNFAALNRLRMMQCAGLTLSDPTFFSRAFLLCAIATLSWLTSQRNSCCTVTNTDLQLKLKNLRRNTSHPPLSKLRGKPLHHHRWLFPAFMADFRASRPPGAGRRGRRAIHHAKPAKDRRTPHAISARGDVILRLRRPCGVSQKGTHDNPDVHNKLSRLLPCRISIMPLVGRTRPATLVFQNTRSWILRHPAGSGRVRQRQIPQRESVGVRAGRRPLHAPRQRRAPPPQRGTCTVQRTKCCRSGLPANDPMSGFDAPTPFLLLPRLPISRRRYAFVTNFTAAEFRALYCIGVVVCDNLCLPFRDESFDAVLSVAVIHHFATAERRARTLRELARVTRIGGRLLLTVWAMEHEGRNFHSQKSIEVFLHKLPNVIGFVVGVAYDIGFASVQMSTTCPYSFSICRQQDVLIPWHRPATLCPPTPAPLWSLGKVVRARRARPPLSSPNETCYSFVRRALQRLTGRRSFLQSWGLRPAARSASRPEPPAADLPIELRRLDDAAPPSRLFSHAADATSTLKSRSLTDIADVERRTLVRSRSSLPSLGGDDVEEAPPSVPTTDSVESRKKTPIGQTEEIHKRGRCRGRSRQANGHEKSCGRNA